MSFNKIYSGMENAPQAIDENFKNSFSQDEILMDETAAALGILEEDPTPEMAFKIIGEKAMPPEGEENWNSGNLQIKGGSWNPKLVDNNGVEIDTRVAANDYVVFGPLVYVNVKIVINASKKTGALRLTGLPEPPLNESSYMGYIIGGVSDLLYFTGRVTPSNINEMYAFKQNEKGVALTGDDLKASNILHIKFLYERKPDIKEQQLTANLS